METINKRVQLVINKHYGRNASEFARDIDIRQSTISGIIGSRQTNPTSDTIEKMLNATKVKINCDWLITGKGEMVLKESVSENKVSREVEDNSGVTQLKIIWLKELIEEYKKEIKVLTETNAVLNYQLQNRSK